MQIGVEPTLALSFGAINLGATPSAGWMQIYKQGDLHTGAAVDLIMRRVLTWSRLVTSALLIDTSPAQREAWRSHNGKKDQKVSA
jgi:hypothetical protein